VTLSTDTPQTLQTGRGKHNLGAIMLSDRELVVTDKFGLRNQGVHSGPPPPIGTKALPVPTSLLIDAQGTVVWMDQSQNYQRRSDPDIVLTALRTHMSNAA